MFNDGELIGFGLRQNRLLQKQGSEFLFDLGA